jgi:hypothetical protein
MLPISRAILERQEGRQEGRKQEGGRKEAGGREGGKKERKKKPPFDIKFLTFEQQFH